ncbi:MAG TPA: hypothetical protein VH475_23570 [Tepidisphaeraceae bacterium]|jgi:tetratricopeptide (TPR) repeat protein
MNNPAYVEYEALLRRLHDVTAQYGNDSAEADSVRERMDGPERHLNRWEMNRLNGLSADLYMVRDEEVLEQPPAAQSQAELRQLIQEYERWNDWDSVLALLRRRPPLVSEEAVAFTRARAYAAVGQHAAALQFFEHAMKRWPTSADFQALHLSMLKKAGKEREAIDLGERYSSSPSTAPVLLIAAAATRFDISGTTEVQGVLGLLTRALRLSRDSSTAAPTDYLVLAHLLRAQCLLLTGNPEEAIKSLNEALFLRPGDAAVQEARDVVLASRSSEIPESFRRALELARSAVGESYSGAIWGRAA